MSIKRPKCPRCSIPMSIGQALFEIYKSSPDFIGDLHNEYKTGQTMSPSGHSVLMNCWKCSGCGHSVTLSTTKIPITWNDVKAA